VTYGIPAVLRDPIVEPNVSSIFKQSRSFFTQGSSSLDSFRYGRTLAAEAVGKRTKSAFHG
jgi:hypothetical protein